jgi:hypothetical protein
MYNLFIILFTLLLTACVAGKTTTAPAAYSSSASLENEPISTVTARLGTPDQLIRLANGHASYIYQRASYQTYRPANAPVAGVTTTRRGPLLVQPVAFNNNQVLQPPAPVCTMIFEVDIQQKIINTKTKGTCLGS